ncbi:MAG: hypothetical protein DRP85_04440 [Candidatus Makaraimicrobium thalassicum]|nr:MAG: hypothetical protein DRP85_04440 [Candidatus Omnitrophota bacterium]
MSRELCKLWNWRTANGQLKDMACRTLLLKLERTGHIVLPARRREAANHSRGNVPAFAEHSTETISCDFKSLAEVIIIPVQPKSKHHSLFNCLLAQYHYLGHRTTVGENMRYLITDCSDRPVSCMLFGSAAWKTTSRDAFIGWDHRIREKNVNRITNNTRFLILPWVKVPHLASHILGKISRRINSDWINKYGHPVYLLETFVDRSRFKGTCYKAANWIYTGQTKGRTRNDQYRSIETTIKDVYVYPLSKNFREKLTDD